MSAAMGKGDALRQEICMACIDGTMRRCCEMAVMATFVAVEGEREECRTRGILVAVEASRLR